MDSIPISFLFTSESLYRRGHSDLTRKVNAHPQAELAITVITVEEELAGWYNLIRKARTQDALATAYQRLADAISVLARWQLLSLDRPAMARHELLKSESLNVRRMDLRIAAIVLQRGVTLVTRNLRDFQRVPGLATEDWTR